MSSHATGPGHSCTWGMGGGGTWDSNPHPACVSSFASTHFLPPPVYARDNHPLDAIHCRCMHAMFEAVTHLMPYTALKALSGRSWRMEGTASWSMVMPAAWQWEITGLRSLTHTHTHTHARARILLVWRAPPTGAWSCLQVTWGMATGNHDEMGNLLEAHASKRAKRLSSIHSSSSSSSSPSCTSHMVMHTGVGEVGVEVGEGRCLQYDGSMRAHCALRAHGGCGEYGGACDTQSTGLRPETHTHTHTHTRARARVHVRGLV